jgi:hypothetical protein
MATKQPIEQGLVDRVANATRDRSLKPLAAAWMGPGTPIPPLAQQTEGRQFDYPVGLNLTQRPRSNDLISFASMRALAENYDLLRLVIETRKDQVSKMCWGIHVKNNKNKEDARCKELEKFFASPNREHDWQTWLRALLEDLFVLDAPTLYPRQTLGGELYALELVDGSTIKRIIDTGGRTPMPPLPAYQQTLKGMPASDYTRDELIYMPRNVRTHKVYGYSPVEQIIMTVNIAMRRQVSQLEYYTAGNVPEALVGVPETWTPEQISKFQMLWDSLMEGDASQRRKAKFVPGGMTVHETRPNLLKDEFDEWLARVVCYAFSVEATPFIHQLNRSVAESAHEQARQEGLTPILNWIKGLIDYVITQKFNYADLEFVWEEEDSAKPKEKAEIDKIYLDAKVLHPDEVRADLGRDPLTPEQKDDLKPPPLVLPEDGQQVPGGKPKPPGNESAKLRKVHQLNRTSRTVLLGTAAIKATLLRLFAKTVPRITAQLTQALKDVGKADADLVARILAELKFEGWAVALSEGDMVKIIEAVTRDGGAQALNQLGLSDPNVVNQVNVQALTFATERAAELIAVTDTTRELLRGLVVEAIDKGWSTDALSEAISNATAFSEARADMIARTEIAIANVEGSMLAYRESGVVDKKVWLLAQDNPCEVCIANAEQGMIDFNDRFDSGDEAPPAHPNCRCDIIPVLEEESAKMIQRKRAKEVVR